jgi:uncharacterized membrane protein YdfJ with MMPL/SSD domain
VAARLADLALRRPWALLGANLAVLAAATVLAVGAPDHLGIGSLVLDREAPSRPAHGSPDLVISTTGSVPVKSRVYGVALDVISSQVRADAEVAAIRRGGVSADGRSTSLLVYLGGDEGDRQQGVERIESRVDAGPLHASFGGEIADLLRARGKMAHDFWMLELIVVPFAVLILVGGLGPLPALAPALCAATAITGALAGLRIVGAFTDISLLGIAPAAVLGLALGIEAGCLVTARVRDETTTSPGRPGVERALEGAAGAWLPVGLAATAATVGLLVTGLDQAPSMVLGCALAAAFALGSALVAVPAWLVLIGSRARQADGEIAGEPRLARPCRAIARFLAGGRGRTTLVLVAAVALMVAAAVPLLHGITRPFPAGSTPPGSPSLFDDLPLAAGVSAGALALALVIAFRSIAVLPAAVVSLLPAAAACGLCVLVFQDGHLADLVGQHRRGALETGAAASMLAAICAVSAGRAATALRAMRSERSLGLGAIASAENVAALTVPAAVVAGTLAAGAAGVLGGADLYSAREFGFAVAAGMIIDLVLVRVPLIAALARGRGS